MLHPLYMHSRILKTYKNHAYTTLNAFIDLRYDALDEDLNLLQVAVDNDYLGLWKSVITIVRVLNKTVLCWSFLYVYITTSYPCCFRLSRWFLLLLPAFMSAITKQ